jgi:heterodisulfide reductase subunit A
MTLAEQEAVRTGVFVCHCGSNIAGYLDMRALVDYSRTLPQVVFVQDNLYTCSEGGINEIKNAIARENLNRVVVASCTPRTHEPLFQGACTEAGLNPYLFQMVNIRDQCSWVHMQEKELGTAKAKDLIRMGVAKAARLRPLDSIELEVTSGALVIGGGAAGLTAAASLANMGYEVVLVEGAAQLGGLLNRLHRIVPADMLARDYLERLLQPIRQNPLIQIRTGARLESVQGYVGNFEIRVQSEAGSESFKVGAVVVATGAQVLKPEGYYGYDGKRVINHLELEALQQEGKAIGGDTVFIQCVGSRQPERKYCSRTCCLTAVKNALMIKEVDPQARVAILYRDMQMYGIENETLFRQSKERGVRYINYDPDQPPVVEADRVRVFHPLLGREVTLPAERVVLSTPLIAYPDADRISQLLRVPLDANKFFLEGHAKLKPLDFASDGVFLCGNCRYPANLRETVGQGLGAAARAATLLSKGKMVTSGIVAEINVGTCVGCQGCLEVCPYQAIDYLEDQGICRVNQVLCKGCGACSATCPSASAQLKGFTADQILAEIDQVMAA